MENKGMLYVLISIILLLVGMKIWDTIVVKPIPEQTGNTKIVYRDRFIPDTGSKNAKDLKPKIEYRYKEPAPLPPMKPKLVHDTLYIDSTNRKSAIYPCWYATYPEKSKLLSARFTKLGISLDLYDSSCKTITQVYVTDYTKFDYFWDGENLKVDNAHINTIPKIGGFWKQFTSTSNLYVTQELLTQTTMVGVDYSLNYKRVGIYGLGQVGYKNDLQPRLNVGLRIKLK